MVEHYAGRKMRNSAVWLISAHLAGEHIQLLQTMADKIQQLQKLK